MSVKMKRWSPWTPATRKFKVAVKVKAITIQGLLKDEEIGHDEFVAIKIKWKDEHKFFQRSSRHKMDISSEKIMKKGQETVQFEDDKWFENTCRFSLVNNQFAPWEIAFSILHGEKMGFNAKSCAIGRVSVNVSEIAWKMEKSSVEKNIPVKLQMHGDEREAMISVVFNIVEIGEPQEPMAIIPDESKKSREIKRFSSSREEVSVEEAQKSEQTNYIFTKSRSSNISINKLETDKKDGWFSWKNSRLISFKRPRTRQGTFDKITESCFEKDTVDPDKRTLDSVDNCILKKDDSTNPLQSNSHQHEDITIGCWEVKELTSRDGKTTLKTNVFFASFDQRSDKAAGESACTALVVVFSHWLHSNNSTPNRLEFDNLIKQGSLEWRKLCENESYVNDFPNKHFDLETVLRADIRPVSISHVNSFVGFFGAEKFESLEGVMSFDEMWEEIRKKGPWPSIYIVSWNDHFFVLKAEENAYYIIDTLGERLFEGCDQAYILKFDELAVMNEKTDQENKEVIVSGKECCKEFIKRFLASIPLNELEEEEKKEHVSYFSLHQRLQIEFNYTCCLPSSPSSKMSSLFSSPDTLSRFPNEECN